MKTRVMLVMVLLGMLAASVAAQDRRVTPTGSSGRRMALVIGNDSYPSMPLRNARNDARAVRDTLRDEGFQIDYAEDATRAGFAHAMDGFSAKLQRDDVALFYYSGHGLAVDGVNYLLPVDFSAQSEADVPFSGYPALQVQRKLEERGTRLNILVLDACRDNPFRYSRSAAGGLAAMREGVGTLIAFAAGDGQRASDNGSEGNGLFTKYLLESMREPGLNVRDMFFRVQEKVYEASSHRQFPYVYAGAVGQFYFRPAAGVAVAPSVSPDLHAQADLVYWESIHDSKNPAVFEDYLRRFPDGQFVVPAKSKLDELRAVSQPPVMPKNTAAPAQQFELSHYSHSADYVKSLFENAKRKKEKSERTVSVLAVAATGLRITENNKSAIEVPCREVPSRIKLFSTSVIIIDQALYYSLFNSANNDQSPAVLSAVRAACNVEIAAVQPPAIPTAVAAPGQEFKARRLEGAPLDWIRQHVHEPSIPIPAGSHFEDSAVFVSSAGLRITEKGQADVDVACVSLTSRVVLVPAGHLVVDLSRWYATGSSVASEILGAISSNCNIQLNAPAPNDGTMTKKAKSKQ